jgi:predicted Zn finger-like uncharacterized protein
MYTQCPECDVAFRVTAEVLRQAAGKVRCGGCGIAFNALEHLSEEKPQPPISTESEPELPELEADSPPRAISAEQSAALLKTLDQLAGSDIRIEDTGIEWRVLDTDSEAVAEAEPEAEFEAEFEAVSEPVAETEADPVTETGSLKFFIEDETDQPEIVEEMRFDDNTPLPDDFAFEVAVVDAQEPEPATLEEAEIVDEIQNAQVDLAFGDAAEWEDLLDDLDESEPEEEPELEPEADDLVAFGSDQSDTTVDRPLDMDTQFAIQAEAMGIDLSGLHASPDSEDPEIDDDQAEIPIDDDLIAAAFEAEEAARIAEKETEAEIEDEPEDELEYEATKVDAALEAALEESGEEIEEEEYDEPDVSDELVIPEMTEEELTINMMIDQELLNVAVEDEDGFASTIVQKQPDKKVEGEIGGNMNIKKVESLFETIVMEGESVRGDADRETLAPDEGVALRDKIRAAGNAEQEYQETNRPSIGMIAAAIALLLMLGLQFMHQSREALATNPAFSSAVGPAYRALGKPLTPAWDISGWRFEQTKNSVDEADQLLTIYTRIGNKSDKALPYPLVHVSMTDRFEDIIGSRVLEPNVYLATNADPRKLVAPGNTFDAVISVESPSDEATGFKLNVCYRQASGNLRCAIEDFK